MTSGQASRTPAGAALRVLAITLIWLFVQISLRAQATGTLELELKRPDAETERLRGRRVSDAAAAPADNAIRKCGSLDLALQKVAYDQSRAYFNYSLFVRRGDNAAWQEWMFGRPDAGRFESRVLDSVKVYSTGDPQPDCSDFQLPLYCLANC
jgi:hypothetical protein